VDPGAAPDPDPLTIAAAVARVRAPYDDLVALGEEIEDEWSYVNDLAAAWTARLDELVEARGDEPAGSGVAAAFAALAEEAAAIDDPHRAIDWMSTFPQIALVALGERP
jgi:hypothetical protein